MEMVGNKRPSITGGAGFLKNSPEPFHKSVSVVIIFEYRPLFNAATDDMMQRTGSVESGFP
jgi:hypothetical protein